MTEQNPYTPPAIPSSETDTQAKQYSGIGVFEDGGMLVISRAGFRIPSVCLKTGEPTRNRFQLEARVLPKSKVVSFGLLGGAIGLMIAKSIWGKQFQFEVPIRSDWTDPSEQKSKRGWSVVWLGLGLILLGMVLSVFWEAGIAVCGIGMVVGVVGLVLGGVKVSKDPFWISHFNDDYVWIRGVDKSIARRFEPLSNA